MGPNGAKMVESESRLARDEWRGGDRLEPGLDVAHEFDGQPVLLGSATEDHQGRRRFAVEPQHVEDGEELPGESVRVMPFSR